MFCPFCGDQVDRECPKPACAERLAATTASPAPEQEPVAVPADPQPAADAPRRVHASVEQCMTARGELWSSLDSTDALVATIESAVRRAAGTTHAGVNAHPLLTDGRDLLAELRAVEQAVTAEAARIEAHQRTIAANNAEIARLNRNRMLMIAAIAAGVLILIILVATAL